MATPRRPTGQPAPDLAPAGASPLSTLAGVGPRIAEKLAARGLGTLQDLWLQLPRGYEDRTALTPMRALQPGVAAQVEGRVEAVERGLRDEEKVGEDVDEVPDDHGGQRELDVEPSEVDEQSDPHEQAG